jgi:hypothetical protein
LASMAESVATKAAGLWRIKAAKSVARAALRGRRKATDGSRFGTLHAGRADPERRERESEREREREGDGGRETTPDVPGCERETNQRKCFRWFRPKA